MSGVSYDLDSKTWSIMKPATDSEVCHLSYCYYYLGLVLIKKI